VRDRRLLHRPLRRYAVRDVVSDVRSPVVLLVAIIATALLLAVGLLWAATLFVHEVWRNADRRDAERAARRRKDEVRS